MKDPRLTTTNVPPPGSPPSGPELHLDTLSTQDEPFAEYLWMEHEEEFNRQVSKEKEQQEEEEKGEELSKEEEKEEVGREEEQQEEEEDLLQLRPLCIF